MNIKVMALAIKTVTCGISDNCSEIVLIATARNKEQREIGLL
jgi:hypothetical protein